jgi:hypothetical protein
MALTCKCSEMRNLTAGIEYFFSSVLQRIFKVKLRVHRKAGISVKASL